jgi:phosphoglycolate phosphatase-like HAD superfamily hydrolase
MVGDQASDMAAARAAGLGRAVLIERSLSAAGAGDASASSFGEAIESLSRLRASDDS